MKKLKESKLFSAFIVSILILNGFFISYVLVSNQVEAHTPSMGKSTNDKWNYCFLIVNSGTTLNDNQFEAKVSLYFTKTHPSNSKSIEIVTGKAASQEAAMRTAIQNALLKLGSEGWESVGETTMFPNPFKSDKSLLFKR